MSRNARPFLLGAAGGLLLVAWLRGLRPWQRSRRAAIEGYLAGRPTQAPRHPGTGKEPALPAGDVDALSENVVDEVVRAFGFPLDGWQRQALAPALRPLGRSFARIALRFDWAAGQEGIGHAFGELLPYLVRDVRMRGIEAVPPAGPLLILSNHPGAYDVPLIASALPRQDLKIVSSTVPLLRRLPHFHSHLIEVTREAPDGMRGLRQSLRHLRDGGALLVLPTGIVDPDPDLLPGAREALAGWKAGAALLLRKAPETQVVVVIVSGVLSRRWLASPLARIQPDAAEPWRQRKLAEFLQIMQQIIAPGSLLVRPRVSFAPPVTAADLGGVGDGEALQHRLVERAQRLLAEHMAWAPPAARIP